MLQKLCKLTLTFVERQILLLYQWDWNGSSMMQERQHDALNQFVNMIMQLSEEWNSKVFVEKIPYSIYMWYHLYMIRLLSKTEYHKSKWHRNVKDHFYNHHLFLNLLIWFYQLCNYFFPFSSVPVKFYRAYFFILSISILLFSK